MKKTILTLLSVLFCAITFAQNVPQGINYQALARDAAGADLANDTLAVQFSIITSGSVSWQENHTVTTNEFGLFTAIIGNGTTTNVGSSSTFDVVDWGAAAHSLKVEIDYGNGYLDMGTTDFMSVPYSLHAKTAANASTTDELQSLRLSGDTLFIEIQGSVNSGNWIILPTPTLLGCTDSTAINYNPLANTDDGSCIAVVLGCTDSLYTEYDPLANTDNGTCATLIVNGCTDSTAFNYKASANIDDGSCIAVVLGCTDSTAFNYNVSANTDDGSCIAVVLGCTDSTAFNYNANANNEDGSCIAVVNGCTDTLYTEYDPLANTDDGTCATLIIYGCTDPLYIEYNPLANTDNGFCTNLLVNGCTDYGAFNYNPLANMDDGSCTGICIGCSFQGGIVFFLNGSGLGLISAPTDQSSGSQWGCYATAISGADGTAIGTGAQNTIDIEAGCTTAGIAADLCANYTDGTYSDWFLPSKDELMKMYLNLHLQGLGGFANNHYWSSTENGSFAACRQDFGNGIQYVPNKYSTHFVRAVRAFVYGCTDSTACNYNSAANVDDGSCDLPNGCGDPLYLEYDTLVTCSDASACATLIVNGCTDSTAFNYDPSANTDDGSCISGAIGDLYQGGIIFYLDGYGAGLICDIQDLADAEWGCYGTLISGADDTAIGTGAQNTIDIEAGCTTSGIAADTCANLTLNGYSDWFLPSKDELNEMYVQRVAINATANSNGGGGFSNTNYWSSTEFDNYDAWFQNFLNGYQNYYNKNFNYNVRAVRAF